MSFTANWLVKPWQQWQQSMQLGRTGHALLIHGVVGVGKTELSSTIAASLLCDANAVGEVACGRCKQCQLLASCAHPDLIELKPDGNQIKIDAVRQLITSLTSTGHQSQQRVVLIHNADQMNSASANALLKTLEEPMPGVQLILICDSPEKLLATVISRCQRLVVSEPSWTQVIEFMGDNAELLDGWPYWSKLLGGPFSIKKRLENEEINQVTQWRKLWRSSLKSGLLEPELAIVKTEYASMVVNVLYYELLYIGRKKPDWLAARYKATLKVSETALWLQRQSGVNLAPVLQQLIVDLRQ